MDELLLQTLERIEGKVDNAIVMHGERLAKVETEVGNIKSTVKKVEARQWWHSSIVITLSGLVHGLGHKFGL